MQCGRCHKEANLGEDQMCPDCRAKFGLPDRWPESRRLRRRCLRCDHAQLIRAIVRERGADDLYSPRVAPIGVTFPLHPRSHGPRSQSEPDLHVTVLNSFTAVRNR